MTRGHPATGFLLAAMALPLNAGPIVEPNYDNVDTSRWRCRLCPFDVATSAQGRWRVGTVAVDDAHPRFGRDNGLDRAGVRGDGGATFTERNVQGRTVAVDAVDLGLASRQARLRVGQAGGHDAVVQWREVPRNVATDGRAPYAGVPTLARLSDVRAFDYATRRRQGAASLALRPTPQTRLQASYTRDVKTGTVETYADRFYRATGLPEPVDHTTEELAGRAVFNSQPWLLAAEVRRSRFRNAYTTLAWLDGAASPDRPSGRVALAPGNDADAATLTSRATLGRTRLSAHVHGGRHRQDDAFLPYTTNEALDLAALPAPALGGEVRTFGGAVRVVTQVARRLRLSLGHRKHERVNKTPRRIFTPVLGDLVVTPAVDNRAYSLRRRHTDVSVRYRTGARSTFALGARSTQSRRAPLEIAGNDERGAWLDVATRLPVGLALSIQASRSTRDGTAFEQATRNNPLTRRYYQATRDQDGWRVRIDYRPAGLDASFSVDVDHADNSYPNSQLGLRRSRNRGWGADFTVSPTAKTSLSAFYESRTGDSTTAGSQDFRATATTDWWSATLDRTRTTGVVARATGVAHPKLDIALAYNQSLGRGRYATTVTDDEHVFPDLVSDHRSFSVEATYRWRPQTAVVARWYLEDYASADWALADVTPTAIRNVFAFGRRAPVYTNSFFGLALERRMRP